MSIKTGDAKVTEAVVAKWAADQRFPLDTLTRVTGLLRRIHRHEQAHRATPEAKSELCRACAAVAPPLQVTCRRSSRDFPPKTLQSFSPDADAVVHRWDWGGARRCLSTQVIHWGVDQPLQALAGTDYPHLEMLPRPQ